MADEIVHEYGLNFLSAYLALPIIKQVLANGTDTTLIYVVYSVIKNRFRFIRSEKNGYEGLQYTHLGIWTLILLFGIADAGLFSYAQVYTLSDGVEETKAINISAWYRNIHLSYTTVYSVVALEMFACAVFISQRSRPTQTRVSRARNLKISLECLSNPCPSELTDFQVARCDNYSLPRPSLLFKSRVDPPLRISRA
jgi:hypothetical protein